MKTCKSCIKEIDDKARKCPYCQSFQIWYANPQLLGLVFIPFILLPSLYVTSTLRGKDFAPHAARMKVEYVSSYSGEYRLSNTYRITNLSDLKWSSPRYTLVGLKADHSIAYTRGGVDPGWVVQARGTGLLTVELERNPDIKDWELHIDDMRNERY